MKLRKIDTLEELRREKLRLRQEADMAREMFQTQIATTMKSGRQAVLGSWKSSVPVVAFAAIKRFVKKTAEAVPSLDGGDGDRPNDAIFTSVENGLRAFQQPGPGKWLAVIPILKNLWEDWILGEDEEEDTSTSFVGSDTRTAASTGTMHEAAGVPLRESEVTY